MEFPLHRLQGVFVAGIGLLLGRAIFLPVGIYMRVQKLRLYSGME